MYSLDFFFIQLFSSFFYLLLCLAFCAVPVLLHGDATYGAVTTVG
jgi:hypothetical protein